jgi:hypothetical protein
MATGVIEIQVSKLRQTFMLGCTISVGQQLGVFLYRGHLDPSSLVGGALGVVVAAVVLAPSNARRASISVQNEAISGPSRWGTTRVRIPLAELDRQRSAERGLFGGRTLWSRSGEALRVSPFLIPRQQRDALDRALGLV